MSQINGFPNAPQFVKFGDTKVKSTELSAEAKSELRGRIRSEVSKLEVLPYQARRMERSGQRAGYVRDRVLCAVVTLGVSEGIRAIEHKAEKLNAQNLRKEAVSRLT